MSGRISSPLGSVAIVGTILLSGIFIGPRGNAAPGDHCLTAPKSAGPAGSHWYYRLDRANRRKCWYSHALSEPAQHAAQGARSKTTAAADAALENVVTRSSIATSAGENALSNSHIGACAPSDHCAVTILTANKFQQVLTANKANAPERRTVTIENNNSNGDSCWVYVGSDSASKGGSQELTAGETYVRYWPFVPPDGIQATCASSSDTLNIEYQ
jgi:hypothetical protein